jgi:hypothetical protein
MSIAPRKAPQDFQKSGKNSPHSNLALVLLAALLAAGCGSGGVHPVQGQVVWKDGSPAKELAGSLIFFEQAEAQTSARGQIKEDGSFQLTTNHEGDGALAGQHTVTILEVGRKSAGGPDASAIAPGKIDTRYSTPSTSDLRAEVKPGQNKITLTVDPWVDPPQ